MKIQWMKQTHDEQGRVYSISDLDREVVVEFLASRRADQFPTPEAVQAEVGRREALAAEYKDGAWERLDKVSFGPVRLAEMPS